MIILLVGTGLYLTLRLTFIQIRGFRHSLRCISGKYDRPEEEGDITHFQALAAALSATIGTGNIAGVGVAIAAGGPGAVFWMWVTALVGMATKFTSCSLALRYRRIHPDGSASGGPMYFLRDGLGLGWLGVLFAIFAGVASLGIGCAVQSNSVVDGLLSVLPESWQSWRMLSGAQWEGWIGHNTPVIKPAIGLVLAFLVGIVIIGGIRRIAQVASRIVPFMCIVYILGALVILVMNAAAVPGAFAQIFHYAFSPLAVGGGVLGVVVQHAVKEGVKRGVFSNEAGLGSAPMAHAAAKTKEMIREGHVAMLGPFIDTIVICTMTALVIIVTGAWQVHGEGEQVLYGPGGVGMAMKTTNSVGATVLVVGQWDPVSGEMVPIPAPHPDPEVPNSAYYLVPTSAALTTTAFDAGLPGLGKYVVAFGLVFFAYSTMISWSYYGDRSFEYLFGERAITPYRWVFCLFIVLGTIGGLQLVWLVADNLNALMAVPNLIALLLLAGVVQRETKDYVRRMKEQGDF
ncbi:sodium:alanine symporter family protein [Candidatus Sumerlaeota bacterium]|nr:sodium:alanine symporter family protein [Candidatus Sumerlaeota bacterium]